MKLFLKRLILFLLPIAIILIVAEFLLRRIPNDYAYKNLYLQNNSPFIETLFLGSSHAYYGINPDYFPGNSFNASHISQSIDLDYVVLNKFSSELNGLKNLVVPIDYFTLFSRTSTGEESWRMKNYNIYYGLSTSVNPKEYFELTAFRFKKNVSRINAYYLKGNSERTCSDRGYGSNPMEQEDLAETGKLAAQRHTKKERKYLSESIGIVEKMIDYCRRRNINLLFYTSPAFDTYREHMDSIQYTTTVHTMDSICKVNDHCAYLNLMDDSTFHSTDFRDADHLNADGAKKLTLKISNALNK